MTQHNGAVIHFEHKDIHDPAPWPVAVDGENTVQSGLGRDDGARLIGFGPLGAQRVTVFAEDAIQDPARVVGLAPTFADGNMFSWNMPVSELVIR